LRGAKSVPLCTEDGCTSLQQVLRTWGAASSLRPAARRSMRDGVGLSGRVPRLRRQPMADLRTVGVQLVLGENHLQQWLFDPSTGDCRDGLHIDRVNQNQGTRKGIPRSCEASKARAINLYYGAADTSVWRWRPGVSVNCSTGWIDTAPRVTMRSGAIRSVPPSSFVVVYAQLF